MIVHDVPQGSDEWLALRAGLITASEMNSVMARGQGKTRLAYMYRLIGERMTGEPTDSFSNKHTERGHEQEPVARELYEIETGNVVRETGFITNHDIGYSPDGIVGDDGLIEIKSKLPHLQAEVLDSGKVPASHIKQCQCGLWVTERQWLDFISYCPGMPLFIQRVERDEKLIAEMEAAVYAFYSDMEEKINRLMEKA